MFDLDGTLVDSVPDLTAAIDAMLKEMRSPPAGEAKVRLWVGNGAAVLVKRALADMDAIDQDLVEKSLHQAALQRFLSHYRRISGRYCALYDGVQSALIRLQNAGVEIAVVTNKPAEFVPHLLEDLGLVPYVSAWLGGDSLAQKKPHPAPLESLLERFGVKPEAALMVGDSRSDMLAGKAAGVTTLGVSYGYNHGNPIEDEAPTWVTDNLDDFFAQVL